MEDATAETQARRPSGDEAMVSGKLATSTSPIRSPSRCTESSPPWRPSSPTSTEDARTSPTSSRPRLVTCTGNGWWPEGIVRTTSSVAVSITRTPGVSWEAASA
ncbi:hypothetical protein E1181_24425 [Saccharopolyspora terrae]|uniref:Uncharacterized protein n=1 Tax=Saccharopolyspora terrae TaxID=2530384 RepID=A0A4R4V8V5_9PSEU|nr:hypothetical protein [Saccharopolyspora terrae]TDD01758.1 hypothetical protein E1181_24425 [Saccharopolyspora terrae]